MLNYLHICGANTYSILNSIMMIPNSIVKCYKYFYDYFTGKILKLSAFGGFLRNIHLIVLIVLIIRLIDGFIQIWKRDRLKSIIYICVIIMIPIACNAVFLIATQPYIIIQTTAPLALCIPLLLIITSKVKTTRKSLW